MDEKSNNEMPTVNENWKIAQANTFLRWCNKHLESRKICLNSLFDDFTDGLNLIALYEVLSGKTVTKYWKNPKGYFRMAENVGTALNKFREEGITFVNIEANDIVRKDSKLILGLIWSLILHYQINSVIDYEPSSQDYTGPISGKQNLMNWVNALLETQNMHCNNFHSDWTDGKLLSALVDALAPGHFEPNEIHTSSDPKELCSKAVNLAHKRLGVAKLILGEEFAREDVDEKSVMTYISLYRSARLTESTKNNLEELPIIDRQDNEKKDQINVVEKSQDIPTEQDCVTAKHISKTSNSSETSSVNQLKQNNIESIVEGIPVSSYTEAESESDKEFYTARNQDDDKRNESTKSTNSHNESNTESISDRNSELKPQLESEEQNHESEIQNMTMIESEHSSPQVDMTSEYSQMVKLSQTENSLSESTSEEISIMQPKKLFTKLPMFLLFRIEGEIKFLKGSNEISIIIASEQTNEEFKFYQTKSNIVAHSNSIKSEFHFDFQIFTEGNHKIYIVNCRDERFHYTTLYFDDPIKHIDVKTSEDFYGEENENISKFLFIIKFDEVILPTIDLFKKMGKDHFRMIENCFNLKWTTVEQTFNILDHKSNFWGIYKHPHMSEDIMMIYFLPYVPNNYLVSICLHEERIHKTAFNVNFNQDESNIKNYDQIWKNKLLYYPNNLNVRCKNLNNYDIADLICFAQKSLCNLDLSRVMFMNSIKENILSLKIVNNYLNPAIYHIFHKKYGPIHPMIILKYCEKPQINIAETFGGISNIGDKIDYSIRFKDTHDNLAKIYLKYPNNEVKLLNQIKANGLYHIYESLSSNMIGIHDLIIYVNGYPCEDAHEKLCMKNLYDDNTNVIFLDRYNITQHSVSLKQSYPLRFLVLDNTTCLTEKNIFASIVDSKGRLNKFSSYDVGLGNYFIAIQANVQGYAKLSLGCNRGSLKESLNIPIDLTSEYSIDSVIIDYIDRQKFYQQRITQIAIDMRSTGCSEFDIKFKGPRDYQVLSCDLPGGICITNIFTRSNGEYNLFYQPGGVDDMKRNYKFTINKPNNYGVVDVSCYYQKGRLCTIDVPIRLYYHHKEDYNYIPFCLYDEKCHIHGKVISSKEELKCEVSRHTNPYLYTVKFKATDSGLHVIQTRIQTSKGVIHLLPFPIIVSEALNVNTNKWYTLKVVKTVPNMKIKFIVSSESINYWKRESNDDYQYYSILCTIEGTFNIQITKSCLDLDLTYPTTFIDIVATKVENERYDKILSFDNHLITRTLQENHDIELRFLTMKPGENESRSKYIDSNNPITSNLGKDGIFETNQSMIVSPGLHMISVSLGAAGKYLYNILSNTIKYNVQSTYELNVVNEMRNYLYIKYKKKKWYFTDEVVEILIDGRHHRRSHYNVSATVECLKSDIYVPQLLVENITGTFIFGFCPIYAGTYLCVIKLDNIEVSDSPIYFDVVRECGCSINKTILKLHQHNINSISSLPKSHRIPDFNPSHKNFCVDKFKFDDSEIFYYIYGPFNKTCDLTDYHVSNNFIQVKMYGFSGLYALCPTFLYGKSRKFYLYPFFFMVYPTDRFCITENSMFAYRVPTSIINDVKVVQIDDGCENHIEKVECVEDDSNNVWMCFSSTNLLSPGEHTVCIENIELNYIVQKSIFVESNKINLQMIESAINGNSSRASIRDMDSRVESQLESVYDNSQISSKEHSSCRWCYANKIKENTFGICLDLNSLKLNPSDLSSDYIKIFQIKEGNYDPIHFTYKILHDCRIVVLLEEIGLGMYIIEFSNKKYQSSYWIFVITEQIMQSNDYEGYIVGQEIKYKVELMSQYFNSKTIIDLAVCILSSEGKSLEFCSEVDKNDPKFLTLTFTPKDFGYHAIQLVNENDSQGDNQYILINVKPSEENNQLKIFGPGLYYACTDEENIFFVEALNLKDEPRIVINGPAPVRQYSKPVEKGNFKITYVPKQPGLYSIKVIHPKMEDIFKDFEINVYGRRTDQAAITPDPIEIPLNKEKNKSIIQRLVVNIPNKFIPLENFSIEVIDPDGCSIPASIDLLKSSSEINPAKTVVEFSFVVQQIGKYRTSVKNDGIEVPGSPFFLNIAKDKTYAGAVACVAHGQSLADAYTNEENYFYVDLNDAGEGSIDIQINDEPLKMPCMKEKINNSTYIVKWCPTENGPYKICITFDGVNIPGSPFTVVAKKRLESRSSQLLKSTASFGSSNSIGKIITVAGPGLKSAAVGYVNQFCVSGPAEKLSENYPKITIEGPVNIDVASTYHQIQNNIVCNYTYCPPIEGIYMINIYMDHILLAGCPYKVEAKKGKFGHSSCFCEGPGIDTAVINETCQFRVDTTAAGRGYLVVSIESMEGRPAESLTIRYLGNGVYLVEYVISFHESFNLSVLFNGLHVVGSPFTMVPVKLTESTI